MKLTSKICDIFEIDYPIALAGMGGASTPELAAAVSNAGGLGILGAAGCQPEELREWINRVRTLTDKPFGVDTLLPASVRRASQTANSDNGPDPMEQVKGHMAFAQQFMADQQLEKPSRAGRPSNNETKPPGKRLVPLSKEFFEAQMQVIIEEKVPVYAAGLGSPGPWMDEFRYNGTKVMAVVGAVRHAVQIASSGLDVVVAQGHDAGGHNSPVGSLALIPQVVDAMGNVPVMAAGGIGDGRGVAAAMMLGAAGAWIGTAFLAAEEAGILQFQKQALVDGTEEGTVISRSVTGKPARLVRSKWTDAWENADINPLPMPYQSMISGPILAAASAAERADIYPGIAGQGMGMIKAVRPAKAIFEEIVEVAETALSSAKHFV
ncbi:MAG: nitronate monooxygenase family protein [Pseudomonadales bacterium]|nr:nitronate monooxygenase family protein [Pseudomonadales bacterium]